MITLNQVQKLEKKVNDAVTLINKFKAEKVVLEDKIEKYEFRIMELEEIADELNKDQNEIEDKIIGALNKLENIESYSDSQVIEEELLQDEETSANSSVSEENVIVETESLESKEPVDNSEAEIVTESDEINSTELIEEEVNTDAALGETQDDNQAELQESITEDPQDGLPENDEEIVEEEVIPTVNSEFGEMPEDESADKNKSQADLFEQSLDIF